MGRSASYIPDGSSWSPQCCFIFIFYELRGLKCYQNRKKPHPPSNISHGNTARLCRVHVHFLGEGLGKITIHLREPENLNIYRVPAAAAGPGSAWHPRRELCPPRDLGHPVPMCTSSWAQWGEGGGERGIGLGDASSGCSPVVTVHMVCVHASACACVFLRGGL